MIILRFQRVGKQHEATFRIVAVDSHFSAKSGKVKEVLGWWNPRQDKFELNKERIEYWLKNGAQVSDSCHNLLVKAKIINAPKKPIIVHRKKQKEEAAGTTKTEAKPAKLLEETAPVVNQPENNPSTSSAPVSE